MNWKLIVQLSLFGLVMGIATVFVIPSTVEPFFWLAIMLVSAYYIATRTSGSHFLHGVVTGVANSVWVTACHVFLFSSYAARHGREMATMTTMPLPTHPRLMMLLTGPVIGVLSGVVIGLLAMGAARLVKRPAGAVPA